jgi:hypothetical protein
MRRYPQYLQKIRHSGWLHLSLNMYILPTLFFFIARQMYPHTLLFNPLLRSSVTTLYRLFCPFLYTTTHKTANVRDDILSQT